MKRRAGYGWSAAVLGCALLTVVGSAAAEQQSTVVVTATRTEVSLQDSPGAITVITREQIAEMAARDIVEVLAQTPGLSLIGRGVGGRKTLSIRGAENRHTLMLVDGRRIAASDAVMGHSNYENSWVPLEDIERIEVVRGPLSALYGSDALGGVVNIITKAPTRNWQGHVKLGGGITTGSGGDNTNLGLSVSGPLLEDLLGVAFAAEFIRDQSVRDKDNRPLTEIEGRKILTFSPRLYFTPFGDHRFELFGSFSDEERTVVGTSRVAGVNRVRDSLYDLDKYQVGLAWSGTTGPLHSRLNVYRSRIDKETINTFRHDGSKTYSPDVATNDVADLQTSFQLAGQLLTLGGEYRKESIKADSLEAVGGKETIDHKAGFAQAEIALLNYRLLLTPGLRYDHHEFFGSEWSPRLYALYKLTDRINLKAGYGHAFNAPTAKQVSPGYFAATGPHQFFGNPDVKPETSDTYEVGVEYFGEQITAKAFYFHSSVKDLIAYRQIGQIGGTRQFEADNINRARIQGVETELLFTLPYNLELGTGYTWLDTEDRDSGEPLNGRPEHSVAASLKHRFAAWGLNTTLRYQFVGRQYYQSGADRAPSYSLWHAAVEKALNKRLRLQVGVENIGDQRLRDKSEVFPYDERGRFIFAALRGTFR